MKNCKSCFKQKELTEFYKNNYSADKLAYECKDCYNHKLREKRKKNPEPFKLANKRAYEKKREERIRKQKEYNEKNPEVRKNWYNKNIENIRKYNKQYDLKKKYNITLEDFNLMLKIQNYCCKICNYEFDNKKIAHVDHNHKTGKVRSLLCHNCNTSLGLMKENKNYISNLIKYLKEHE